MSNLSLSLEQASREAQVISASMRAAAEDLGVTGVSEVLTRAQIIALLELAGRPGQSEIDALAQLSLAQIMIELTSVEECPACIAPLFDIIGRFQREPDHANRGEGDQGTNYLAFAHGKLAEAARTGRPSGGDEVRRGESGLLGALIDEGVATAFSGGTTDQDVEIAEVGIRTYKLLQETKGFIEGLPPDEREAALLDYLKRRNYLSHIVRSGELGGSNDRLQRKVMEEGFDPRHVDRAIEAYFREELSQVLAKHQDVSAKLTTMPILRWAEQSLGGRPDLQDFYHQQLEKVIEEQNLYALLIVSNYAEALIKIIESIKRSLPASDTIAAFVQAVKDLEKAKARIELEQERLNTLPG